MQTTGWTEIVSRPLAGVGDVGEHVRFDVQLPQAVSWGEIRVILQLPSAGEYWRDLGAVSLVGLSPGAFHTLSWTVSPELATTLGGSYADLTVRVVVNAPAGQYLLDAATFAPDGASGGGGGTDGETFVLQLPAGVGLHSVVLGGTEAVTVADSVFVTASTPGGALAIASVGSNETNLGTDTRMAGDVISVGPVKLRDRAVVEGNVTTSAELRHDAVWAVNGAVVETADLTPFTTYTWTVEFPPSNESHLAGPQQTVPLAPGAYANVDVHPNGVLELSSGIYTMNTFRAESDATVRLNFAEGPILLYVREALTFRGALEGADAGELLLGFLGAGTADIDAPFEGTVVAPNAHLRLSPVDGSGHEGSFFGRRVENDAHSPLVFTPFAHWDLLIPPEIIVECLTRSAAGYGAGVFGYLNRLDIPVEILEGPRNSLSSTRLHKGPLEVFLPGEHRNQYSIPFRGDALDWALSGNVVTVDNGVERCTFDNYEIAEIGAVEPLKPLPQSMAQQAVPLATLPDLVTIAPATRLTTLPGAAASSTSGSGSEPGVIQQALTENTAQGGFDILVTTVAFDEEDACVVGNTDVDLVVAAYDGTAHHQSKTIDVFRKGWSFSDNFDQFIGLGLADLFDDKTKDMNERVFVPVWDDIPNPQVRLDVVERDQGVCGDDDRYARVNLVIDPATLAPVDGTSVTGKNPKWYEVTPTVETLPEGGDPTRPLYCGRGRVGWGVCFQILPSVPPRLCADFPTQYLDSDGGEDLLAGTDVQAVPAAFATVELNVTGGIHAYTPWTAGYAVLDADGCLPAALTPTVAQLTPASSDFQASFMWRGGFEFTNAGGGTMNVQIDRVPGQSTADTWVNCGATGNPFENPDSGVIHYCGQYPDPCTDPQLYTNCYRPAASVHSIADGSWRTGENRAAFGTTDPTAPTSYSMAAATVAHLLRRQALGTDLGIGAGTVHVWPEALPSFFKRSPYHAPGLAIGTERFVLARPPWTSIEPDGSLLQHEADTARKYTMTHELTHAMQDLGAGNVGNGAYGLFVTNPDGTTSTQEDPEGFPVECRCNHIGKEFLPAHCLNSIEPVGGASGEGYAHSIGARAFNEPSDPNEDCWFLYAKDSLVPPNDDGTCPSGSVDPAHPGCIQIGSPEGQALVAERYSCPTCDPVLDQPRLSQLEHDRNRLLTELAGWFFVLAPARVDCADAKKWRNHYCAEELSAALAGSPPAAVEYLGTELDWLQFMWGLTRGPEAWTPTQFLALQRAACAQRICSRTEAWSPECDPRLCQGGAIGTEAWRLYDELAIAGRPESAPGMTLTETQWNLLRARGDAYGISTNLQP